MGYQDNISTGLRQVYERALVVPLGIEASRFVILSDQHKGAGDAADDFQACEAAYKAALDNYLALEYTLVVLGDSEELWECRAPAVLNTYPDVLALEAQFHRNGRHWRFYGNHDDEWSFSDAVTEHLGQFFGELTVHEGLRLAVQEAGETLGELFLVHGHQGTTFSSQLSGASRLVVRYLWRPFQRLTGLKLSTPSTDWRLRHTHDIAMYNWAVERSGIVLIAGHTHHAIFPSQERAERLAEAFTELEALSASSEELEYAQAELAFARAQVQPCYLNSGCCSFSDGSITGIEIDAGRVRLVRWHEVNGAYKLEALDAGDLRRIMSEVVDLGAPMPTPNLAE